MGPLKNSIIDVTKEKIKREQDNWKANKENWNQL